MIDLRKRDKFCFFPRINWEIYFRHIKINLAGCTICFSCWLTLSWIWFLSHIPNFTCKLFYSYPLFSTIPSTLTFYSEFHSHSSIYRAINTNDFLVPTPLEFSQGFLLLLFLGIFIDYGNSECLLQGKIFCFDSVPRRVYSFILPKNEFDLSSPTPLIHFLWTSNSLSGCIFLSMFLSHFSSLPLCPRWGNLSKVL